MSSIERGKKLTEDTATVYTTLSEAELLSNEEGNPFADKFVAEYYRDLYEKSKYECRAVFDPELTWSKEEEKNIVRKLDYRVALAACFLFAGLQIDRGNLSQAVADNMLPELNMNTNQYNLGNQLFYLAFILAEIPSQLLSKKFGPDIFIPIQMIAWSIAAMSQAAITEKCGFYVTRWLIGMLEGGFIADMVLWLSYFYTSKELPIRLAFFWTSYSAVQILTSLLAFVILRMRGILGMAGWQWLFLLEGILTFLIGISGFYLMIPSAVQSRNALHPNGWFTEREEKIVVNRVLRDDPSKGDMHNRQALSLKLVFSALKDYDLWPIYIIGLVHYIANGTVYPYLTLILKSIGFSTLNVQLLTIPQNVLFIIFLLLITRFSELVNQRALIGVISSVWTAVLLGIFRWWPGYYHDRWPTFVLVSIMLAAPYIHAICVSWVSTNSNSIATRAISGAVYNMFVQVGSIVSNQIYREDDIPLYHRGNEQLFWLMVANIPLFIGVKLYYMWRNSEREKRWGAMSPKERQQYIATTSDRGNKRLDFRFTH